MDVYLTSVSTTLLGGRKLGECTDGADPTCVTGFANGEAIRRGLQGDAPSLILPQLSRGTPFLRLHPLGINLNRLILQELLGYQVFTQFISIIRERGANALRHPDFPLLMSDVEIPTVDAWSNAHEAIFYDANTHMALISPVSSGTALHGPVVEMTKALLDRIALENEERGCIPRRDETEILYDEYVSEWKNGTITTSEENIFGLNNNASSSTQQPSEPNDSFCWIPVIISFGFVPGREFLDQTIGHINPPAVVILETPLPEDRLEEYSTPQRVQNTWVFDAFDALGVPFGPARRNIYRHYQFTVQDDSIFVQNFSFHKQALAQVRDEWKDETYFHHISEINKLQQEAMADDPIIGYTSSGIPRARPEGEHRCFVGECEAGNLLVDALRWKARTDVALMPSFYFSGDDIPPGPMKRAQTFDLVVRDLPLCTLKLSGLTIFKLLSQATRLGNFDTTDGNPDNAKLIQVSGMRYSFNSQLSDERIISIDVWNKDTQTFEPLERLTIYSVASNSWFCRDLEPFATMVSPEALTIPGEENFEVARNAFQHAIMEEYLRTVSSEESPLDFSLSGRLVDDPTATTPLSLVQEEGNCAKGTVWLESTLSCVKCPDTSGVQWRRDVIETESVSGSDNIISGTAILLNGAPFPVTVGKKASPPWLSTEFMSMESSILEDGEIVENSTIVTQDFVDIMSSGNRLVMNFTVSAAKLEPGTAVGTVSFGVSDGGDFPGCVGSDASFEVKLRVVPQDELNQLGSIRWAGWVFAMVVILASVFCASMVIWRRNHKAVRFLQPVFLVTICIGVAVLGMTLITLSFDDEIVSDGTMDAICQSTPWLLAMGFSLSFSALFSKLWRINRLFDSTTQCRRTKVEAKDAVVPAAVIFFLNFVFLVVWSIIDPLRWDRKTINSEEWNTYGVCRSDGNVGRACMGIVAGLNFVALITVCWQAYKARNLSEQFSESKQIGVALFSWLQLVLVCVPVTFVTSEDNVQARYFLQIGMVFGICISMLICLFAPILAMDGEASPRNKLSSSASVGHIHVSGFQRPESHAPVSHAEYTLSGEFTPMAEKSAMSNDEHPNPPAQVQKSSRDDIRSHHVSMGNHTSATD